MSIRRIKPAEPGGPQVVDKPQLSAETVKEFVSCAHSNPERVRALLDQHPALLNAAWDWGEGDWETALGAAAHMGRRDIANLLLERGARIDIFAAAMLGHLKMVQAVLEVYPDARRWPGPHGISLLRHAEAGGKESKPVADFLSALTDT
jgi:hypothetical protein